MDDTISRQKAIDAVRELYIQSPKINNDIVYDMAIDQAYDALVSLPSAQPERIQNNAVHLCDSCQYTYVTCPSHGNDAVFGDGKGNDNICACNKYRPISALPEIIRCNACIHWTQTTGKMHGFGLGNCDFHNAKLVNCNGFCYWAERRDDG